MNALDTAISIMGSQRALASAIGVSDQVVSNWKSRGSVAVSGCHAIQAATQGAVTCEQLRPDIFRAPVEKASLA